MSVCYDSSGIPIPCSGWTGKFLSVSGRSCRDSDLILLLPLRLISVYDSYVTDPRYQRYFTIAWTSTLALLFVFTIPSIVNFSRRGPGFGKWQGYFGVYDDAFTKKGYEQVTDDVPPRPQRPYRHTSSFRKPFIAISAFFHSFTRFTPHLPFTSSKRYSSLSSGHILFLLLIPLFIFATLFPESQLAENPNRFGFLALACIPPLFVLSSKNGAINLLLGKSWIAVNFLHRWLGRSVLLLVVCHFGLWTVQVSLCIQSSLVIAANSVVLSVGTSGRTFRIPLEFERTSRYRRLLLPTPHHHFIATELSKVLLYHLLHSSLRLNPRILDLSQSTYDLCERLGNLERRRNLCG